MGDTTLRYADLPDAVMDFISDPDRMDFVVQYANRFGLAAGSDQKLLVVADQLVLGKIPLAELPNALVREVGMDKVRAPEAASEFAAARLLPIASLMNMDVAGAMRAWGADPSRIEDVKQIKPEANPAQPAQETPIQRALADTGAVFSDPVLQHRLELVVASYRDGVRTREQAVAVLMRPMKTGGLAMSEQAAGDVLVLVSAELGEPKPAALEPVVENSKNQEPKTPANLRTSDLSGAKADTFTSEDEDEVKRVAEQKKAAMETPALITDTKAASDKIASDAKVSFATGELKTRFEHIIDARLRDVRDGFETRAKLEAPVGQGGLGIAGTQLASVMEAVETMDAMHHKALAEELARKKGEARAKKAEAAKGAEATARREAQVMAKRYAEITGKAPTDLVVPTPSRPTSAPTEVAVRQREGQIDTAKVRAAIEAAKAPAPAVTPVLSEASIPSAPSGRPKVEDIRFERKLAGPVEELRLMTLVDFRRLSNDPRQAARKLQDKVELVGQEGYDRRIAAIRAWRESPLSREYVALSREALIAGRGIVDILAARRAAGEDVPTDEELRAVIELNGILRF